MAVKLRQLGYDVETTHEPGGTWLGARIRAILLEVQEPSHLDPTDEVYLFCLARKAFVREVVVPALTAGRVLISDRFELSSFVYQSYTRGIPCDEVEAINTKATGGLKAHRTYLFDLSPEIGLQRVSNRGDFNRLDAESLAFHRQVRAGYLNYASTWPNIVTIDATKPPDEVAATIMNDLLQILPPIER